jgi:sugar-specific transcriptional regulator TrmB
MDLARRQRLQKLGFEEAEAEALSALHTRNFM